MTDISIVDYGSGNLKSVYNSVKLCCDNKHSSSKIRVTSNKKTIDNSTHLILPGVGSFKSCVNGLKNKGILFETIYDNISSKGKPFLGICVGMQMLFLRDMKTEKQMAWGLSQVK